MQRRKTIIPVNSMSGDSAYGISVERLHISKAKFKTADEYEEATQSHRDAGHTFHFVEKGFVIIEIDFVRHRVPAGTLVYMHPSQVHRVIDFNNTTVCSLAVNNESLDRKYLTLLEELAPVMPLSLTKDARTDFIKVFSLCLDVSNRNRMPLHQLILKDCSNALVALMISSLLHNEGSAARSSRATLLTRSFRQLLEQNFNEFKRPAEYAGMLNVSVAYLNQCIKEVTGMPVSHHIQNRVILEAKRLLYHTEKSVKEIAVQLGYEDYPYFSRLFTKVAGVSALSFRNKNND